MKKAKPTRDVYVSLTIKVSVPADADLTGAYISGVNSLMDVNGNLLGETWDIEEERILQPEGA